jgi:hypothetical protein
VRPRSDGSSCPFLSFPSLPCLFHFYKLRYPRTYTVPLLPPHRIRHRTGCWMTRVELSRVERPRPDGPPPLPSFVPLRLSLVTSLRTRSLIPSFPHTYSYIHSLAHTYTHTHTIYTYTHHIYIRTHACTSLYRYQLLDKPKPKPKPETNASGGTMEGG